MTNRSRGSIFLLGGGLMQMPAIEAAGELGLSRHLADGNSSCRGRNAVEHFHHVDLRDLEGLVHVARKIPDLLGVFTAGTDFSRSVAYVCDALGLPGIPFEVANRATDKSVMRATLQNGGVRVPEYVTLHPGETIHTPPFPLPVVVKPVDNMGARGVVLVSNIQELSAAISAARAVSPSEQVIVEQFIEGDEYSIDALVYDGTVTITGIGARHIFFAPFFVELGHTIPADLTKETETVLREEFTRAVRALGITRGAAKGDVFLTGGEDGLPNAVIGEIAARLSGGFMSGWTYPLASGVPLTRLGIEIALGGAPSADSLSPSTELVSVERALVSAPGIVTAVDVQCERDEEVREIFVNCSPGDRVAPPHNNVEKVANVIVVSENRHRAERRAEEVLDGIRVVLAAGERETDAFIFESGWAGRFSRYRAGGVETETALATPVDVTAALRWATAPPFDVVPLETLGGRADQLVSNQISIPAAELTDLLTREGIICLDVTADRDISVLFWRALVAAGRQGVRYLTDTVKTSRNGASLKEASRER